MCSSLHLSKEICTNIKLSRIFLPITGRVGNEYGEFHFSVAIVSFLLPGIALLPLHLSSENTWQVFSCGEKF